MSWIHGLITEVLSQCHGYMDQLPRSYLNVMDTWINYRGLISMSWIHGSITGVLSQCHGYMDQLPRSYLNVMDTWINYRGLISMSVL